MFAVNNVNNRALSKKLRVLQLALLAAVFMVQNGLYKMLLDLIL